MDLKLFEGRIQVSVCLSLFFLTIVTPATINMTDTFCVLQMFASWWIKTKKYKRSVFILKLLYM